MIFGVFIIGIVVGTVTGMLTGTMLNRPALLATSVRFIAVVMTAMGVTFGLFEIGYPRISGSAPAIVQVVGIAFFSWNSGIIPVVIAEWVVRRMRRSVYAEYQLPEKHS